MHRHLSGTVFLAVVLLLAAPGAEAQEPDVSEDLARARKAWEQGDALRRKALHDFQLIEQQEKAYDQAEKAFRDALKKDPKHPYALADFGRFWLARREYAQARTWLEAAQDSPRANMFTAAELADIYRTLGGLLERAGEIGQALDRYRKALDKDPEDVRNLLSLAVGFCAAGKPQEARELLKPWAEKYDAAKPGTPAEAAARALGFYTFAVSLEEIGFLDEALHNYNQALELAQTAGAADSAGVADCAAMALVRLEEISDAWQSRVAERAKENAARKEKKQPPLPVEREEYAKAAYRCDEGLRYKNLALRDSSFNAALLRLRSGEGAANAETESIEKHPSFDSFLAAMQAFQDAISKHPKMARAHYELGLCNLLLGRFGKARGLLDAAAVYSPNDLAILHLQGEVLLELGQWQEAATAFKKVLLLEPESGRANFGLARAYAGLQSDERQCQAALDALDRALQLGLRDRRIFPRQRLLLNNGREMEGDVREEGAVYVLQLGEMAVSKADVKEVHRHERHTQLVLANGRTLEGDVREQADTYLIRFDPLEVPKKEVKELIQRPGLRDQLNDLRARFERGEKPATGPVLRGSQPKRDKRGGAPNPWSGTIFEN